MFSGTYHGKQAHECDLDDVIQRARDVGCEKFMVTGSDLVESEEAVKIARNYRKLALSLKPSIRGANNPPFSWILLRYRRCAPLSSQDVR